MSRYQDINPLPYYLMNSSCYHVLPIGLAEEPIQFILQNPLILGIEYHGTFHMGLPGCQPLPCSCLLSHQQFQFYSLKKQLTVFKQRHYLWNRDWRQSMTLTDSLARIRVPYSYLTSEDTYLYWPLISSTLASSILPASRTRIFVRKDHPRRKEGRESEPIREGRKEGNHNPYWKGAK